MTLPWKNGTIITDVSATCELFNDYFVNIAKGIGDVHSNTNYSNHPSIKCIKKNTGATEHLFSFSNVTRTDVFKQIMKLNGRKSCGWDNIPPKILKLSADIIAGPLTELINMCITKSWFPKNLKHANVTPIYKKGNHTEKENYRPVSVLPAVSKVFERVLADQLAHFTDRIYSPFISAFRKTHSCNGVLIKLVEDWKLALDSKEVVGSVMMDLSKAFDSMNPELLLSKLEAYGMCSSAVSLLSSYLTERKQRVKIGHTTSSWEDTIKGVPQGSVLGPVLFNIFINDLFYFIDGCELYNYADDNTISAHNVNPAVVISKLTQNSIIALQWFKDNGLQANPDKFQCIFLGPDKICETMILSIVGTDIRQTEDVKLLGVIIDRKLNFDNHVRNLCQKAGRQLNVLARLSKYLDIQSRMHIFKTFILANFNYCPSVWHFCSASCTNKVERIQERGLRFVFRDFTSSYETLLSKANTGILQLQRLKSTRIACEVFK